MTKRKELDGEQRERVRAATLRLLEDATQAEVAARAGVHQGSVSRAKLSGLVSHKTAIALLRLAGDDPDEALGLGVAAAKATARRLPQLAHAIELAQAGAFDARTIAYAGALAEHWPVDRDVGDWVGMLDAFNAALAGAAPTSVEAPPRTVVRPVRPARRRRRR